MAVLFVMCKSDFHPCSKRKWQKKKGTKCYFIFVLTSPSTPRPVFAGKALSSCACLAHSQKLEPWSYPSAGLCELQNYQIFSKYIIISQFQAQHWNRKSFCQIFSFSSNVKLILMMTVKITTKYQFDPFHQNFKEFKFYYATQPRQLLLIRSSIQPFPAKVKRHCMPQMSGRKPGEQKAETPVCQLGSSGPVWLILQGLCAGIRIFLTFVM